MKKRIAFISEHASPLADPGGVDAGGQNVYVAELARCLARQGCEIDIYTRWERPGQRTVALCRGVRVVHVQAGPPEPLAKERLFAHMPEFRDDMLAYMERWGLRYDLLHANFWMSAWVASEIKARLGTPYVITFHALGMVRRLHQGEADGFPAARMRVEEETARDADCIIAECPQDRLDLIRYCSVDPAKIQVIPCGVRLDEFFPVDRVLARRLLGIEPGAFVLLQLGRMVRRKGVDNVIRALARLKGAARDARLLIVGGETDTPDEEACPEIGRLRRLARSEGVLDQVLFAGRKGRHLLKYYYSAADVFVTTPWYEPFGLTPLESMACGTPVIGAAVGGIPFSVADGRTGWLVPPNDPEALAARIDGMASDSDLLRRMRAECRERVRALFTWEQVSSQMRHLYEGLGYRSEPAFATSEGHRLKKTAGL